MSTIRFAWLLGAVGTAMVVLANIVIGVEVYSASNYTSGQRITFWVFSGFVWAIGAAFGFCWWTDLKARVR